MSNRTQELRSQIDDRTLLARSVTQEAGQLTWDYFERGVSHETKSDQTPVTVADREAERLLRDTFRKWFPDDGFLGEEFGEAPGTSGFRWIIDPIDATKNFVRGIPLFATLVGLELEGEMVAGIVSVPVLGHLYHAAKDCGAYRNDQPIRVSDVDRLSDAQLCYSSIHWFDRTGTTDAFLDLVRQVGRTRGFGDFYGHLLVAVGSVEVMLDPGVHPWDIAALKPIVEEAGGILTDWRGKPDIHGESCITANPAIHRQVMEVIKDPSPPANPSPLGGTGS